ncbi:DNA-binding transcriptional regulator, LacI/PurR family [Filimonas lacunae]|uniref:DNA-binding transcriptional regulator, LacI/PurR family n=1 Tax=Filimonas lacunae TaxID=477680 RepID=A0A173MKE7_9BACT|nr:GntR family transcriptional regulator [Filimonas lacunae]BAV07947.1 transcriptional regulator of fucose utilization, GntR family [Filimonas lacunae]SIT07027.1 DNA-binding transcriptional regulator, LacI/PurR family [Filimonas lacunae]
MRDVYQEIRQLESINGLSKHEQLVQGIINAINDKILSQGDMLPSVNSLIKELGFARETIAKSYKELTSRGIVESKNRVGFYVANEDTEQNLRLALIIFAFDSFQEVFYKTLRDKLGKGVHIDVFFHHNNMDVFESIISNVRGKYGMYVVAPIPHKKTSEILGTLPMSKFLMIDRYEPLEGEFSYVAQEFEKSSYAAFKELSSTIQQYKGMIYYHRPSSDTPIEILNAYKKFIKQYKINSTIKSEYIPGTIEKGYVYFTINNSELWAMLKDCMAKGLKLGKEVGILSHNDDLVKEIICDGITTYSTDFTLMAERAAEFVLHREKIQEIIPTVLIRRNSL